MRETRGWFEFGLEMADKEDEESDAIRNDREGRGEIFRMDFKQSKIA